MIEAEIFMNRTCFIWGSNLLPAMEPTKTDGISMQSTKRVSWVMKPTKVSEMTATESTIEKYSPRLFLKETLSSL